MHIPSGQGKESKKKEHTQGTSLRSGVVVKCRRCVPIGNRYRLSKAKPEPARSSREQIRAYAFKGRKFMPVSFEGEKRAYDVPSTVSPRRILYTLAEISLHLPFSLSTFTRLLARSNADHSSLSVDGEPLSKSYATQHRSSVDYFSKSSGSRIFKWRLNETGFPRSCLSPSRLFPSAACERMSASVELETDDSDSARSLSLSRNSPFIYLFSLY